MYHTNGCNIVAFYAFWLLKFTWLARGVCPVGGPSGRGRLSMLIVPAPPRLADSTEVVSRLKVDSSSNYTLRLSGRTAFCPKLRRPDMQFRRNVTGDYCNGRQWPLALLTSRRRNDTSGVANGGGAEGRGSSCPPGAAGEGRQNSLDENILWLTSRAEFKGPRGPGLPANRSYFLSRYFDPYTDNNFD